MDWGTFMTVQIFTTVVNRPNFVEIQQKLFQKFLKDEYQFHVIDDSVDEDISKEFKNLCLNNNISYYKKPSITSPMNPAQSCAAAVQWTYDNIITHYYIILCIVWYFHNLGWPLQKLEVPICFLLKGRLQEITRFNC